MKVGVFSHCTIDEIHGYGNSSNGNEAIEVAGGPSCYISKTNNKFNAKTLLFTKFGKDFDEKNTLEQQFGVVLNSGYFSEYPTTRFVIRLEDNAERSIYLKSKCEPITVEEQIDLDANILSPVFDEVSEELFEKIKLESNFLLLDPQGFLRQVGKPDDRVSLVKKDLDLKGVSAIHVDKDEAYCITSTTGIDSMKVLQKKGIDYVLYTNKSNVSMLYKDTLFNLELPVRGKIKDTTGLGDIFCSAFTNTILHEKDSLWAICFAVGAVQAALELASYGLDKVPEKRDVEVNATYLYNTLDFQKI